MLSRLWCSFVTSPVTLHPYIMAPFLVANPAHPGAFFKPVPTWLVWQLLPAHQATPVYVAHQLGGLPQSKPRSTDPGLSSKLSNYPLILECCPGYHCARVPPRVQLAIVWCPRREEEICISVGGGGGSSVLACVETLASWKFTQLVP